LNILIEIYAFSSNLDVSIVPAVGECNPMLVLVLSAVSYQVAMDPDRCGDVVMESASVCDGHVT